MAAIGTADRMSHTHRPASASVARIRSRAGSESAANTRLARSDSVLVGSTTIETTTSPLCACDHRVRQGRRSPCDRPAIGSTAAGLIEAPRSEPPKKPRPPRRPGAGATARRSGSRGHPFRRNRPGPGRRGHQARVAVNRLRRRMPAAMASAVSRRSAWTSANSASDVSRRRASACWSAASYQAR